MLELVGLRKSFRRAAPSRRGRRGEAREAAGPETTVALDGLSLRVPDGRIVGFVGANGAGKTTTMRIALGVLQADSGDVLVDGRPADPSDRRRMGYMPEERGLYPKMRVADQIAYLARLHGYDPAAAQTATARWLERLGVSERHADRVESLSLGNQQRVQLAAALVHHPRHLVLDEPFSGLDPIGVDVMSEVLREAAAEGTGVVFSSHQLELVERLCDEVVIVRSGEVVASGTVSELAGVRSSRVTLRTSAHPSSWLPPTVTALSSSVSDGVHVTVVEVARAEDVAELVHAAAREGDVLEATPAEPSLSEIYREVVAR